jgi:hypothetical protein
MKETAGSTQNSFLFDPFDDAETMVRVDDLVADLECHVSPVAGSVVEGPDVARDRLPLMASRAGGTLGRRP